jgi:hypothetical protein
MQLVIGCWLVVDVKMKGEIMGVCDSGVVLYLCVCIYVCMYVCICVYTEIHVLA